MTQRTQVPDAGVLAIADDTVTPAQPATRRWRSLSIVLWIVQVLVALLFLFAGGVKLVLPLEMLAGPVALPGWFLRFIGVAEVLGAIGLVIPGATRIRPGLTPWAAIGLAIVMVGATAITITSADISQALVPAVAGALLVWIAIGRSRLAPIAARARPDGQHHARPPVPKGEAG
jgi:hypothetical protein